MTLENARLPTIIADAFQTLARSALSADEARPELEAGLLPAQRLGRVALIGASLLVTPMRLHDSLTPVSYRDERTAYEAALRQWDVYQKAADTSAQCWIVRTCRDLDTVLASWQENSPLDTRLTGLVLTLSGADPVLAPRQFDEWYERGVRVLAPAAPFPTRYAATAGSAEGLTAQGRELLDVIRDYGVLLDLANSSDKAFRQMLERHAGSVIVSHGGLRREADQPGNLSESMVRALAERGGVMGVALRRARLTRRSSATLETVVGIIDTICQMTGSSAHVALGSHLPAPAGQGISGADHAGELLPLEAMLLARGYTRHDVAAVLYENLVRLYRAVLP